MDPALPIPRPDTCPDCGAKFAPQGIFCWMCGWKLGDRIGVRPNQERLPGTTSSVSPGTPNPADLKWTFSLSTLFIWTALVGVVMGVVRIAPGLGILLAIAALPAALITVGVSSYRKRRSGRSLTPGEKAGTFAASFAAIAGTIAIVILVAIVIAIAAVAAFFVSCLSMLNKI